MKKLVKNIKTSSQWNHRGFTFIEILIAIAIFVLAVLAAVNIASGSVKATQDAKEMTMATWLLQQKMVELETQLETKGIDDGCEDEKQGKFEAPYENYSWLALCQEIDFYLSESAALLAKAAQGEDQKDWEESENAQQNQITKMILETASDYLAKTVRELHVEVFWKQAKADRVVSATTHYADFDQKLSLGGMMGGGGGSESEESGDSGSGSGGGSGSGSGGGSSSGGGGT